MRAVLAALAVLLGACGADNGTVVIPDRPVIDYAGTPHDCTELAQMISDEYQRLMDLASVLDLSGEPYAAAAMKDAAAMIGVDVCGGSS